MSADYTGIARDDLDEDDRYESDDSSYCYTCYNTGTIITCPDDLCQDGCIHGDGEEPCPDCED